MKYSTALLLLCLMSFSTKANAILKGRITNEKGEALSFVNVFIKGTQTGTTCNEQGLYELKLQPGSYEIIFQYVGYKQKVEAITISDGETKVWDVQLEPGNYTFNDVNVVATAEDPAYPIMRQAIARRGIYLREAKEYQCKVYMKGMQRLTTVPKRVMLMKVPEDIKPGIVYLSESLSELSFQQPDKVKERMISSKVSGDNKAFSYNQAAALQFTLYDNIVPSYGLNQRGFVSPLANDAMMYYKYKLIGESKENGQTIFKIQLIPVRKHDPVFRGYIYIVKNSWRLHSTDLLLDKESNIEFVDTIYIKQNYAPQPGGVWMPVAQRLIFQFEILGFKGNGYFVSVYSNYKVNSLYPPQFYHNETTAIVQDNPTPQVRKVEKVKVNKVLAELNGKGRKEKTDSAGLFDKKYFNNELLSIDKKANRTDDSTWDQLRPIPLTDEEKSDYHEKDSVQDVHESRVYMDSIDRIENKPDWTNFLLTGYTYSRSYKKQYFTVYPVLTIIQYNTVEGWVFNPGVNFTRTFEDNRKYEIAPNLRYGSASEKLYGQLSASYTYNPIKESSFGISGGYFVEQYNSREPITEFINTSYTLFAERNYLKEYQKTFVKLSYKSEVINGLVIKPSLEYNHRMQLQNHTDYTWTDYKDRVFTPNIPVNGYAATTFPTHQAMIFDIQARITFSQYYVSRPDEKINYGSKYPKLNVQYRKGIHLAGSDVNFDEFNIWVNDNIGFKLWGASQYIVRAGAFLNTKTIYFPDFHHFDGNLTIFAMPRYQGFQLLDYYYYSTKKSFIEAHYSHHFNGFFFNKIPLLRKLKWQEVASLNYLKTTDSPHYLEWGAGIEHIFKLFRVDYFQSYMDGSFKMHGIRIGFGF